ncbi:CopG family ribbon-helix-helix protein [Rhizobium sp. SL86]|uniref:CopG family ribbon-helix-helix protein n=1 Tax=Rhizobium sp. SL86 TaxID=2995148 RepID=UPI0022736ED6|nr:ribbon-helix-helix domain-containing protein [Rhizobium sp. SL86]MCY1664176.1 ribbon-helix-helix domain-containing protein [Rhizobium sp. SL86]
MADASDKPVLSDPITLRIPEDILAEVEEIAKATERSRSWVIVRALKYYLMAEGAEILSIQRGLADEANGDMVDAEDLFAELAQMDRASREDAA